MNPGALIGGPGEQKLLDDLIVESIQIHGLSVMYLPRKDVAKDPFFLEDAQVTYDTAVEIEVYLKSFDGFQGDGDFFSTMGVEIRDQAVFSVARTRFEQELGPRTPHNLFRPREGDLIWYPLNEKLFEIRYVDKFAMHYPLGKLFLWDIKTELMEYSNQTIATGVPAIDRVMELSQVVGANTAPDPLDDSEFIAEQADDLLDFGDGLDVFSQAKYGVKTKD